MKLLSFAHQGGKSFGMVSGDHVADLGATLSQYKDGLKALVGAPDFVQKCNDALPQSRRLPISEITFLPPIANPDKIICVGLNYEDHRLETRHEPTSHPTLFSRFANTQCAHLDPVLLPACSNEFDYEAELAIVIGTGGRNIARETALDHIAGYSCYNDVSVRDWQIHSTQFLPGKNFPGTGAFGPYLVTADEISDPHDLSISCKLNGQTVQSASTAQMIHRIDDLIHYISQFTELVPGDVVVTGTPGGVGFTRNPPLFMKEGDQVEVEIEKVGVLSNEVQCA